MSPPLIIEPKDADLGGGAMVRRVLPNRRRRMVGPFTFLDHFGPMVVPAGAPFDVRPHPHVHLATLSYLFEGEVMHRDSLGCVARITPGDVAWMYAGRGIVHSERRPEDLRDRDVRAHGLQNWIALPLANEDDEPSFQHCPASSIPEREEAGVSVRVAAGEAFGLRSPVQPGFPLFYAAAEAGDDGGALTLPAELGERAIYVVAGSATVGDTEVAEHRLAVLPDGETPRIALSAGARAILLGGEPVGERVMYWNFVASTPEKIEAAKERWRSRGFPPIPGDDDEFIPLPD